MTTFFSTTFRRPWTCMMKWAMRGKIVSFAATVIPSSRRVESGGAGSFFLDLGGRPGRE
jgi:hypothetical protein